MIPNTNISVPSTCARRVYFDIKLEINALTLQILIPCNMRVSIDWQFFRGFAVMFQDIGL
jgi:hypothetical protein